MTNANATRNPPAAPTPASGQRAPAAAHTAQAGQADSEVRAITPPAWRAAHASLVFVWLWTAVASVWEFNGRSQELLAALAPYPAWVTQGLILSGAAVDLLIGLWLWWRPSRAAYATAATVMGVMTLLATALQPDLWLHPLGPLSKNLPIAALLYLLWQSAAPAQAGRAVGTTRPAENAAQNAATCATNSTTAQAAKQAVGTPDAEQHHGASMR